MIHKETGINILICSNNGGMENNKLYKRGNKTERKWVGGWVGVQLHLLNKNGLIYKRLGFVTLMDYYIACSWLSELEMKIQRTQKGNECI